MSCKRLSTRCVRACVGRFPVAASKFIPNSHPVNGGPGRCLCPFVARVVRASTLAESTAEFVAALQQIVKLPLSDCVPTNRYIFFVLRNRAELHGNYQFTLVRPHPAFYTLNHCQQLPSHSSRLCAIRDVVNYYHLGSCLPE